MLVAEGGFGLTRGGALTSISWSVVSGSPVMGSLPFSAMNFSTRRRSKMCPETGDKTGWSGTSWEMAQMSDIHLKMVEVISTSQKETEILDQKIKIKKQSQVLRYVVKLHGDGKHNKAALLRKLYCCQGKRPRQYY